MKRRAPDTPSRPDVPLEPPLDFGDDDEDFDTIDTVELVVTAEDGASSRVICIAIDGDSTGVTSVPPPPARRTHA